VRRSTFVERDSQPEEEDSRPDTCYVRRRAFKEGSQAPQADALEDLLCIHASCVHDAEGKCGLLLSVSSLCWEINLSCGLANDEDKGFKRHDPTCAARPLRTPFVDEGCRLADSMNEEEEE
jgi:hypothetical protein